MPVVRVRDIDLYYEIHGTGPRLFFIGGSGGDLRQRPGVFDGPLVEQFQVLSYDQRGLGRSSTPPGPYTMQDYAEDAAALLDTVGWDHCLVMGVSFGGMVAQELVIRFPDRVQRLVLACTSSGGSGGGSFPLHELQDLAEEERLLQMIGISDTRIDDAWKNANPDALASLINFARRRSESKTSTDDDAGDEAADASTGQRLQLEARAGHDSYDRLAGIALPVYICAGKFDGIAPPDNQHELAKAIPNARLDFFDGGHMFLIQDKTSFRKIAAFLLEN